MPAARVFGSSLRQSRGRFSVLRGLLQIRKEHRANLGCVLESIAGFVLLAVLVLAWLQVFMRYVVGDSTAWSEEISRLLLIWVTFLAAGAAARTETFMSVDSLLIWVPEKICLVMRALINTVICATACILVWYGWKFYQASGGDTSTSLGFPRNLFYLPIPVGGVFIAIFSGQHAFQYALLAMTSRRTGIE
ncbi:TRAP transporter small permease [Aurantimonas sp. C2-5-R2]|uniref:TRAP transporter small permease n=1 Tax=Aurantimonas sp. C2-5-R2 TaxID=3113713 RepID=UPI002F91C946